MRKFLGILLTLVLFVVGGVLIWAGFHQPPEEAPQITVPISAPEDQKPVGPTAATVKVYPEEEKAPPKEEPMKPEAMAPNHIYIPALGIYGKIDQETGSLQGGTLTLPQANKVTRWQEGSNVTSDKGNILIAGHVSWHGVNGLIHDLAYIKAGNLAYVTDAKGNRGEFQLQNAVTILKDDLPQSVWDTTGSKKLVVVTCGGSIYRRAGGSLHFDSNIIATFVPVEATPPSPTPSSNPSQ